VARKFASRGLNAILSRLAVAPGGAAADAATLPLPLPRPGVGFVIGFDLEGVSYKIVECSRLRRSNARREPSAPTDTKESTEPGAQATSYTSRSCAMSCVTAVEAERSQTVQVVSIEDVTTRLGLTVFHEKDVRGAVVGFGFLDCLMGRMWNERDQYHTNDQVGGIDFLHSIVQSSERVSLWSHLHVDLHIG
jgi:hypothetical protein